MEGMFILTRGHLAKSVLVCALAGVLVLAESAMSQSACHQPDTRAWVRVIDANGNSDTEWFGFDPSGTCGVDTQLCEWTLGEPCGAPSDFFCVLWIVGDQCAPEGQGTVIKYNYYAYRGPTQIDTFVLAYQPGPPDPRFPVKISWSRTSVDALYDSVVIADVATDGDRIRIRMDLNDSLLVTDNRIYDLCLTGYGAKPSTANSVPLEMPRSLFMYQNYPNPFNPATVIRYQLLDATHVILKVYNVFGEEVATLVDGMEGPGFKSVEFDGRSERGNVLPSGVYFYRIVAGTFTDLKKMLLIR